MQHFIQKAWWVFLGFLLPVSGALAEHTAGHITTGGGLSRLPNPLGATDTFAKLADKVLGVVSTLGGIVAVFFIIYSGFLFVTAGGNETKQGEARKALLYAVIGTAILIGAQALSAIITTTINSLK